MRAEDYVKYFRDHGGDMEPQGPLNLIFQKFLTELQVMILKRRPKTDKEFAVIMDELSKKWSEFARAVHTVREDGFEFLVKTKAPAMYDQWMKGRAERGMATQAP